MQVETNNYQSEMFFEKGYFFSPLREFQWILQAFTFQVLREYFS